LISHPGRCIQISNHWYEAPNNLLFAVECGLLLREYRWSFLASFVYSNQKLSETLKSSQIQTKLTIPTDIAMNKIEHIGIAVRSMEASNRLFSKLLGKEPYKIEEVASEGVRTSFFEIGDLKIELLEATRPDSPIAKFIDKKGEGVHHVAFAVENIKESIAHHEQNGFELINKVAKDGADNKIIAFLHPKSTNGVLVELCQEKKT
jgi:methylmalonyl-CoA/ethylmalonyl-CoA epimerase